MNGARLATERTAAYQSLATLLFYITIQHFGMASFPFHNSRYLAYILNQTTAHGHDIHTTKSETLYERHHDPAYTPVREP
jgi:hypothetical protein